MFDSQLRHEQRLCDDRCLLCENSTGPVNSHQVMSYILPLSCSTQGSPLPKPKQSISSSRPSIVCYMRKRSSSTQSNIAGNSFENKKDFNNRYLPIGQIIDGCYLHEKLHQIHSRTANHFLAAPKTNYLWSSVTTLNLPNLMEAAMLSALWSTFGFISNTFCLITTAFSNGFSGSIHQ